MADVDLKGNVDINIGPANRSLATLANRFRTVAQSANTTNKSLREKASALATAARAAATETKALGDLAKAQAEVNKRNQESKLIAARATDVRVGTRNASAESAGRQQLVTSRTLTEEVRRQNLLQAQGDRSAEASERRQLTIERQHTEEVRRGMLIRDQAGRAAVRNQQMAIRDARERERIERNIAREAERAAKQQQRAFEQQFEGLSAMRYAMYDVAQTAGVFALGMGGAAVAPVAIAVQWERAFADVVRTVNFAGNDVDQQIAEMRDGFVNLAQTIPTTWAELTEIGSLAGQLGIANEYIVDFTESVAKFSATTDVGVNDAATAFGRINALLPDVQNDFEGVADAIAHVGNNSIATESQIVRIITQISNLGQTADFSYQEIVGFAGALASIGVAPELARGVTTRVFQQLNSALDEGGVKLERWGRIAGMSGDEFRAAWANDSMGAFTAFMRGVAEQGGNAQSAIRELGITSVRDVPILQRLAMASSSTGAEFGLLAEQIDLANNSAGAMDREFGVIAATVAAKIQILQNSIQGLMDVAGSNALGPLGTALDVINQRLSDLTRFAGTDVGGWLIGLGGTLLAVGAGLAAIAAVGLTGLAGVAALTTMLYQLSAATGTANLSMKSMLATLAATGPAGAKAAVAIRALGVAMKALAAVTIVLALPDISRWASNTLNEVTGMGNELVDRIGRIDAGEFGTDLFLAGSASDMARDWGRGILDATGFALYGVQRDVQGIDEELATLARSGEYDQVSEAFRALSMNMDLSSEETMAYLPDLQEALKEVGVTAELAADGTVKFKDAAGNVVKPLQQISEAEEEAQQSHQEFLETFSTARSGFMDWQGMLDSMVEKQKKTAQETADDTADMSDSWQTYYDGVSVNIDDLITNLQKQLDAQGAWEDNMMKLAGRVPDAYLAELAAMGPEAAPLIDALANTTDEKLQKIVDAWQKGGSDSGLAFAEELELRADIVDQVAFIAGEDAAKKVSEGLRSGKMTLEEVVAEYGIIIAGMPTPEVLVNTMPARAEYDSLKEYGDSLESWATMFGKGAPARKDFDDVIDYANALRAYATLHGKTGPAREDFNSAKEYADALKAWIDVYADTSEASGQVARWQAIRRSIIVETIVSGPAKGFNGNNLTQAEKDARGYATGGAIYGPGTSTSDSVLIRASAGEHMLTAREVSAMGGHAAVLDFRRQLLASRGYATGGQITPNRSQMTGGTSVTYSAGNQSSGPIELSPIDRMLLRRAGNLQLKIGERTVARAVNNHTTRENNRGAY